MSSTTDYGYSPEYPYVKGEAWKNGKYRYHPCPQCDQADMRWTGRGWVCDNCHHFQGAAGLEFE